MRAKTFLICSVASVSACLLGTGCALFEKPYDYQPVAAPQRATSVGRRQLAATQQENVRHAKEIASLRMDFNSLQENQRQALGQLGALQEESRNRMTQLQELRALVAALEERMQSADATWRERMDRFKGDIETQRRKELEKMNKTTGKAIADAVNAVQAGQDGGGEDFVVQKGHTLSAIAAAYKTTVKRIMEVNGLKSDVIHIGQKLKIPAPTR